ncbi:MAG: hypothetical protein KatS3mg104_2429 [Phycisphaerae bacterium]|jgi:uncharacterized protein (DUF58 family)|nr:MAG: hypothetical protein KatS3mg104_2429 [Phycisphaerae bacterium]
MNKTEFKKMSPPIPESSLLDSDVMSRLDQLNLLSRKILNGKINGEFRSNRKGRSLELADFKNYTVGDDLRFLDWNSYARLDRLFVKLFREEGDLSLHVLIDTSGSENYGTPNKFRYMQTLAAALGYIGLVNYNRVKVSGMDNRISSTTGFLRGRGRVREMLSFLQQLKPSGVSHLSEACRQFVRLNRDRGICVIISDFFDKSGFESAFRALDFGRYDIYALQILSPQEIDPRVHGRLKLVDVEDGDVAEVIIHPPLLARYKKQLDEYCLSLSKLVTRLGGTYLFASTSVPFDRFILRQLYQRHLFK